MLVISLTSIPPRFGTLPRVIAALQAQSARPDRIILTLPRRYPRFPGSHLVPELPGVQILRPESDPGPAAKVLAAARLLQGRDCDLLYCDDDWLYHPGWAAGFLAARQARGARTIIAASGYDVNRLGLGLEPGSDQPRGDGTQDGFVDIAQGFAGVLIRPGWLDRQAHDIAAPAWAVDDIWLSGSYTRLGLKMWKAGGLRKLATPLAGPAGLQNTHIGGQTRNQANRKTARLMRNRFDIWSAPGPRAAPLP